MTRLSFAFRLLTATMLAAMAGHAPAGIARADANGHYTIYYRPDPVGDQRHEVFTPGTGGGLPGGGVVGYWKPFNLTIH
jgi:hypothetical protein